MAATMDQVMYARLLSYVALGAACALGAWLFQGNRYERQLSDLRTEYATAQARAVEQAHAETLRLQERKDEAERLATVRLASLARSSAAAGDALERLRRDLAARPVPEGNTPGDAPNPYTTAVSGLLLDCANKYRGLAQVADGHVSDIKTLMGAWPK